MKLVPSSRLVRVALGPRRLAAMVATPKVAMIGVWNYNRPSEDTLMALIRCPDCEREISSEAAACPHCGRPRLAVKYVEKKTIASMDVTLPGILIVGGLLAFFLAPSMFMPLAVGVGLAGVVILIVRVVGYAASH